MIKLVRGHGRIAGVWVAEKYGIQFHRLGWVAYWPTRGSIYPLKRKEFAWPWCRQTLRNIRSRQRKFWDAEWKREYYRLRGLGASHDAAVHSSGWDPTKKDGAT